jgi:hypothetical protein
VSIGSVSIGSVSIAAALSRPAGGQAVDLLVGLAHPDLVRDHHRVEPDEFG